MSFIKLRGILSEPKPDPANFVSELERVELRKEDLNILLRKAVESKLPRFSEFCSALVRQGASVNFHDSKDHVSNLMIACEKGTVPMVEALLNYPHLDLLHTDNRQLHAGFYAVENKSKEDSQGILRLLLQRQRSMVDQQAGNQTLLIAAIRKGKGQLVKLLLEAGSDPNWQVPDTGNSSLHDAVKQFRTKQTKNISEIIRLLLLRGADSMLRNKQQKTVYEYAQRTLPEYKRIEELVRQQIEQEQSRVEVVCRVNDQEAVTRLIETAYGLFEDWEGQSEEDEQEGPFDDNEEFASLTEEIIHFEKECLAEYESAQRDMKPFLARLQKLVQPDQLAVEVFGSFATGLWVKHSNIDLQLTRKDIHSQVARDVLERLCEQLKRQSGVRNVSMMVRRGSTIRVEVEGARLRVVHIVLSDRGQTGKAVVKYICEQLAIYSELRPMFFVLKSLSCQFRLQEQKSGGIRSYTLFIMLLSCILKWNSCRLGKLLIDYLFYFGFYYDHYELTPEEDYSVALHIVDPLTPGNDLGKVVRAAELQRMFRAAYIALHSTTKGTSKLKNMFEMHKIMLP